MPFSWNEVNHTIKSITDFNELVTWTQNKIHFNANRTPKFTFQIVQIFFLCVCSTKFQCICNEQ